MKIDSCNPKISPNSLSKINAACPENHKEVNFCDSRLLYAPAQNIIGNRARHRQSLESTALCRTSPRASNSPPNIRQHSILQSLGNQFNALSEHPNDPMRLTFSNPHTHSLHMDSHPIRSPSQVADPSRCLPHHRLKNDNQHDLHSLPTDRFLSLSAHT